MHYRFLTTFNKNAATTSAKARRYAYNYLTDSGFVYDDNKRWGYGMADWFVIGGRWSGELSRHSWAKAFTEQMDAIEQEKNVQVWGAYYGDTEKQRFQRKLTKQLQAMWDTAAPPAYRGIPIQRDTYKVDGYEDDAMLLTQELYDGLLKEYRGAPDSEYHADLDYDEVSPEMVGNKWIAVVDYHC